MSLSLHMHNRNPCSPTQLFYSYPTSQANSIDPLLKQPMKFQKQSFYHLYIDDFHPTKYFKASPIFEHLE